MKNTLELALALEALEEIDKHGNVPGWCEFDTNEDAHNYHAAFRKGEKAIAALKEAIKQQQNMAEVPELNAMEYWLRCNPPHSGAGYAACWQAACKWQRDAIKQQDAPIRDFEAENYLLKLDSTKLRKQQGEPVAYMHKEGYEILHAEKMRKAANLEKWTPLYTSAPAGQGEPVAWMWKHDTTELTKTKPDDPANFIPLYTSAPTIQQRHPRAMIVGLGRGNYGLRWAGKDGEAYYKSKAAGHDVEPLYTSAPTIPAGWKLVPIKSTPEMEIAGCEVDCPQDGSPPPAAVWDAMMAVAPEYKGEE